MRHKGPPEIVQHSGPEGLVFQKGRWNQKGKKSLIYERDIKNSWVLLQGWGGGVH